MKLIKLLKRDFTLGTIKNWYKFLVPLLIVICEAYFFKSIIASGLADGTFYENGTIMDYLLYVTQGMPVFHFSPDNYFSIPIYWFSFQIGIAYIIAYYPEKDFANYGKKIFLATGSRIQWWISKCIWGVFNVILYFSVLILAVVAVAGYYGADMKWTFSEGIMKKIFGDGMQYIFVQDVWLISVILPCLITVALALLQMIVSFVLTPVVSFALTCGIYVLSAYYTIWILPGSYAMWIRSSYVVAEGVNPEGGILIAVFLIVTSVFAGCFYFDQCDII